MYEVEDSVQLEGIIQKAKDCKKVRTKKGRGKKEEGRREEGRKKKGKKGEIF